MFLLMFLLGVPEVFVNHNPPYDLWVSLNAMYFTKLLSGKAGLEIRAMLANQLGYLVSFLFWNSSVAGLASVSVD